MAFERQRNRIARGTYLGPMNHSVEGNPAGRPSGNGIVLAPGLSCGVATASILSGL